MKRWLVITVALMTGAGCATTTTAGSVASDGAPRWFAENAPSDANGETTERGPDQPSVVVEANSPTDVRIRNDHEDVVTLIKLPRRRTAANHRSRTLEGMLLGTGMGALTGALLGSTGGQSDAGDSRNTPALGASICGVIGMVVGAAVGAAIERRDNRRQTW